jgi:hypothetical protein
MKQDLGCIISFGDFISYPYQLIVMHVRDWIASNANFNFYHIS